MEVQGDDLDDPFATAASAVAEWMVDPATVSLNAERRATLTAPALDLLLYDRLSELMRDIARKVVSLRPIGNTKG